MWLCGSKQGFPSTQDVLIDVEDDAGKFIQGNRSGCNITCSDGEQVMAKPRKDATGTGGLVRTGKRNAVIGSTIGQKIALTVNDEDR